VLDGTRPEKLPESLLDLTKLSYRARQHLAAQEESRVELPSTAEDPETARAKLRRQAENATQHVKEDMRKKGLAERDHYYSASERSQTGEIDGTYDLDRLTEGCDRAMPPWGASGDRGHRHPRCCPADKLSSN
jgi:hypothetical protein